MPNIASKKNNLDTADFDQSVGEIVSFLGLKGVMKVTPSSNNPSLFLEIKNVLLRHKPDNLNRGSSNTLPKSTPSQVVSTEDIRATVKSIKLVKKQFQVQLIEYDSRTAVEKFRGLEILTPKEQLRKLSKNEWWLKDLIGMDVYSTEGKLLGKVCDAPGEHGEFLEIRKANGDKGQTIIVSFVDQLFPVVDLESRRIEMNDLPGLFD